MKWREHAELLLRKAAQAEYLLDRMLDDPAAPTEAFGFHAQQAAEKMLKAALAVHEITYPRTHRLADLLDALRTAGVAIPRALNGFGTSRRSPWSSGTTRCRKSLRTLWTRAPREIPSAPCGGGSRV